MARKEENRKVEEDPEISRGDVTRAGGKTTVHGTCIWLGSARRLSEDEALTKAWKMKAEALGLDL